MTESVFGTPPEPIFNLKGCCLSSELLEELLHVQAAHNEKAVNHSNIVDGAFKQGSIAGRSAQWTIVKIVLFYDTLSLNEGFIMTQGCNIFSH